MSDIDPRYPIGRYERATDNTPEQRSKLVGDIAALPALLRDALSGISRCCSNSAVMVWAAPAKAASRASGSGTRGQW
jgi:hypothetical protein